MLVYPLLVNMWGFFDGCDVGIDVGLLEGDFVGLSEGDEDGMSDGD